MCELISGRAVWVPVTHTGQNVCVEPNIPKLKSKCMIIAGNVPGALKYTTVADEAYTYTHTVSLGDCGD